jgi:hypothetical protein
MNKPYFIYGAMPSLKNLKERLSHLITLAIALLEMCLPKG